MDNLQFTILDEKLNSIKSILEAMQVKRKVRQTKIPETRTLPEQLLDYTNGYPPSMIKDFLSYWEEGDRWKKEKVFDVGKRLERWKRQSEKWQYEKEQKQELKKVVEKPVESRGDDVIEDLGFSSMSNSFNDFK